MDRRGARMTTDAKGLVVPRTLVAGRPHRMTNVPKILVVRGKPRKNLFQPTKTLTKLGRC